MEIKLDCGITIEPNEGIFGLDEGLTLTEGYDNTVRVCDNDGNPIELTADDKRLIGTLMIDRWQRFMGISEGFMWSKAKPIIDQLTANIRRVGKGGFPLISTKDALELMNYIFLLKGTIDKLTQNPAYVVLPASIGMSELIAAYGISPGLIQEPLTRSQVAVAIDNTPPAEDFLRVEILQCARDLAEASKLLRQHYPGVAEMLRIAADRAAKVAEGVREPQSVGEIIRRDQLRSIIVPAIRANMESRDTTRLTNDLIDAFIKAEMEQRQ